jgi:predicted enzyme related to lactoylglutathione lyase
MPSPRRTPPTENSTRPYAAAAQQDTPSGPTDTPADPQRLEMGDPHRPESGDAPTDTPGAETGGPPADLRRLEPQNIPPAAGRPGTPNPLPALSPPGQPGNQRSFAPATGRRPETVGVAKVPPPRPLLPGLQLQPMVHVDDMPAAVAFYEKLGGEVNHGDRDGEWVLMQVGTSQIGLVTRPPDASRGESTVELNFTATMPLDRLEQLLRAQGVTVVEVAVDRDLGVRLHVETPDGMPIKIHQVEPELMV